MDLPINSLVRLDLIALIARLSRNISSIVVGGERKLFSSCSSSIVHKFVQSSQIPSKLASSSSWQLSYIFSMLRTVVFLISLFHFLQTTWIHCRFRAERWSFKAQGITCCTSVLTAYCFFCFFFIRQNTVGQKRRKVSNIDCDVLFLKIFCMDANIGSNKKWSETFLW